jgi:hypothetical protein
MSSRLVVAVAALLVVLRLPSLVQPMGADQSLYAYVGERIRAGGLPYRDAWDQKPPAVHFLYAGLRTAWAGDAIVPATDLIAAAAVGLLLFKLGNAVGPPGTGAVAALLFLLLSNPAFTRVAGIRLRSQCETFVALAVTAAFFYLLRHRKTARDLAVVGAGALFGIAFTFKYNTAVFAVGGVAALWLFHRLTLGDVLRLGIGFCLPPVIFLTIFALGGALHPLIDATIAYNLEYSGETYAGVLDPVRYLLTFPIERARVDALWTLGGAGCIVLLGGALSDRARLFPVLWVAAAGASIAINGSRSLPQYFVQANPALALAAAWGGVLTWGWIRDALGRPARDAVAAAAAVVVLVGVWRVNQFPKLVEQTAFDARYALGAMSREAYLARYDDDRKYSALAAATLGAYLRAHSAPTDRVYVFGFTCAAYVEAQRTSASRFFWSRPVIVGFNADRPGYGIEGLLSELDLNRPSVIALQQRDWAPDVDDSATFFMSSPRLAGWLQANYVKAGGPDGFDVWLRRTGAP